MGQARTISRVFSGPVLFGWALFCSLLGATAALAFNLDGGGSSTFWQQGSGVVNHPSDGDGVIEGLR